MNDRIDDETLVALMRTAATAQDAPPAAFGHAEIVATSQRITRRRRMVVAGAAGLVLLAGIGSAAALPLLNRNGASSTVAEAPAAPAQGDATDRPSGEAGAAPEQASQTPGRPLERAAPGTGPAAPRSAQPGGAPDAGGSPPDGGRDAAPKTGAPRAPSSASGGASTYSGPGLGPSPGSCGSQQDPELRAVLDEVFPKVAGASQAMVTQSCRAPGERAVHLEVSDGEKSGLLTVVSTPKGGAPPGGDASAPTASGGRVVVSVEATGGGAAPFAGDVDKLAADLGPRL